MKPSSPNRRSSRGRPSLQDEGYINPSVLESEYKALHSIRKVALLHRVSPTTIQKYLKGTQKPLGRPPTYLPWEALSTTPIHAWFVAHRDEHLPRDIQRLSRMSSFTVRQIRYYLTARQTGLTQYLLSLQDPRHMVLVLQDVYGNRVPTNLIKDYSLLLDLYTCDVTLSCVMTFGGMRTITIPYREYEQALLCTNPQLKPIGIVRVPTLQPTRGTPQ